MRANKKLIDSIILEIKSLLDSIEHYMDSGEFKRAIIWGGKVRALMDLLWYRFKVQALYELDYYYLDIWGTLEDITRYIEVKYTGEQL